MTFSLTRIKPEIKFQIALHILVDGEFCTNTRLIGTSGQITSAGYPTEYGNDLDCIMESAFCNSGSNSLSLEIYVTDFRLGDLDCVTFLTELATETFCGTGTAMSIAQYHYCKYYVFFL